MAASVAARITYALEHLWSNPSSSHDPRPKQEIERAREAVAAMVGARNPADIVFMSGGTEANNAAVQSMATWWNTHAKQQTGGRDVGPAHFVVSELEHPSILAPLRAMELTGEVEVSIAPIDPRTCQV